MGTLTRTRCGEGDSSIRHSDTSYQRNPMQGAWRQHVGGGSARLAPPRVHGLLYRNSLKASEQTGKVGATHRPLFWVCPNAHKKKKRKGHIEVIIRHPLPRLF